MSSGDRDITLERVRQVQHLIEQCILSHMNRAEVINYLRPQVDPGVTELVWQKLEAENQEFFEAYNLRLALKQQILIYNELLGKQAELMHQVLSHSVPPSPIPNGSHMTQFQQNSGCYAADLTAQSLKPGNVEHTLASHLPNPFSNGMSPQGNINASIHVDALANTLIGESTNVRMQGMNEEAIKLETGYHPSSQYMFAADANVLEARPAIGVTSFGSMESSSHPLSDALLDVGASSYILANVPGSLSFSSSPIYCDNMIGCYSGSPYLATDARSIFDSHQGEIQLQEVNKALDTISDGFSYDVGSA